MAVQACPSCGGPLVAVDRYADPAHSFRMPFPSPDLEILDFVTGYREVLICMEPGCVSFAVQRDP